MKIIDAAKDLKKPTNKEVLAIIEELYEKASHEEQHLLALLYRHFLPNRKTGSVKTAFDWVAKAVAGPKEQCTRPQHQFVYATGQEIVATNGHICFVAPDDREPGYYHPVIGYVVDETADYPDYKRLFPDSMTGFKDVGEFDKMEAFQGKPGAVVGAMIDQNPDDVIWIQTDYYKKLCCFGEPVMVRAKDNSSVIVCDFGNGRKALVMPVRPGKVSS